MAKVKKEKMSLEEMLELALVKGEDRPYEVPGNWVWTKLEYINNFTGKSVDPSKDKDKIFELYSVPSCDNNFPEIICGNEIGSTKQKVSKGDVLLCKINPRINRVWMVSQHTEHELIASSEWIVISNNILNSQYLMWCLKSKYFREYLLSNVSGVGGSLMRAQPKFVKEYPIPLPPITEQKRIVDIIESLFEKLDTAKELAQNALDSFENRKAAILHKAFTGELTAKWREANHLIPVKSILKDIEEERYNLQKNHSANKSFSYKKSIQIEMQGRTKGIDKLFELPNTWDWVSLGQVTWNVSDGPHFSPNYVDKEVGVPIISARNVKYKNIDFSDAKYVSNEDYKEFIKRGKPEISDILLTKGGTTGIPTTVDTDREFCIWVHIALLKIIKKYASSEYIRDVLASTILYRQSQEQTHGVGNQDLGLTRMIYMALPLPPLDEQKEIVRILDNLLENEQQAKDLCDVIEKIDLMKKAILARAFRGELGTNDSEEESAIEILKEVLKENI